MNIPAQKRFRIPIVFDSDSYSDYSYSYESYSSEENESIYKKSEVKKVVKPPPRAPFAPRPPQNNSRSRSPERRRPILRPIVKANDQRPSSAPADNHQNDKEQSIPQLNQQEKTQQKEPAESATDSVSFEIENPEFREMRTYALIEKKNTSVFKKSRTFIFMEKGNVINQITLKSLHTNKVRLTNDIIMYIRNNRTEFVLKTNEKKPKSLANIVFLPPFAFEECKRKAYIHFGHNTGGMLPSKIVSLPSINETVFNGHFYIESKRNVSFAVLNNSQPVLMARQIKTDIMEMDTILNISESMAFCIAFALYVGKSVIAENEEAMNDKQKFQILHFSKLMNGA